MNKQFLNLGLAVLALSAIMLSACGGKDKNQAATAMAQGQMPAPSLAVATVEVGSITLDNSYPATIKGKTDVDVRPMVSGNIVAVHVDEGQTVHKGQILFTIDQTSYQAAVNQAEAAVASARTAVETAQISVNSNRALYNKQIISDHAMQLSENQLAQAKAALAQAQAGLTTARKNLSYTEVTAPSAGVIGTIPLRVGALASPSGQALTTVSDNSEVYAYFSLTEREVLDLTNGGEISLNQAIANMPPVQLRLANGQMYPQQGKVSTVSGVIDAATGASTARALFPNANGVLRSGSTATVVMPMTYTDVIIIPQSATSEIQNLRFAYTVDSDNVVHQTAITVLAHQDGKNFVVTSGLQPGDVIVTEGVGTKAKEGTVIEPVKGE